MAIGLIAIPHFAFPQFTIEERVNEYVSKMTLEEKVSLCHGGSAFGTKAIPRLGLPAYQMDDGPHGVRGPNTATYFPTGVSLASTWNPELVREMGESLGQETKKFGFSVILGPAVNMVRTPLGGRSFEYMSEDPFLAGSLAVPYIQGVQSQGVAACVKHYAANSQEIGRDSINSIIDEQTLHEIYLPAFKAAVQKGGVLTVMAAYNKVNGWWCSENDVLQNQILKRDWGFTGAIMSDWGAVHHTVPAANFGMDLEMPGSGPRDFLGDPLLAAVRSGQVKESTVDDKARRVVRAMFYATNKPFSKLGVDGQKPRRTARKIANESIVLLKNDRGILPLDSNSIKSIALIGPAVDAKHAGGGGSSAVYPPYEITPLQGIKQLVGPNVRVETAVGAEYGNDNIPPIPAANFTTGAEPGLSAEYFSNTKLDGQPKKRIDKSINFRWDDQGPIEDVARLNFSARWSGTLTAPKSGRYTLAVRSDDGSRLFVNGKLLVDNWGDHATETKSAQINFAAGEKVAIKVEYYQGAGEANVRLGWIVPGEDQDKLLAEAVELAKRSDVAILCVGTNHSWDTEGNDKPSFELMGKQAQLISAILAVNPRTVVVLSNGSPISLEPWLANSHAVVESWYAGMEGGNALADILFGRVNPSGKLPVSFPKKLSDSPAHANGNYPGKDGQLRYDEGILIGYRYFDTKKIAPAFPFGHGLSYTKFEFSNLVDRGNGNYAVRVKNVGPVPGKEVVQVYVHAVNHAAKRPEKELKAFVKVDLNSNETKTTAFNLDRSAFAYWNAKTHEWTVDAGTYEVLVGSSSRDIRQRLTIKFAKGQSWLDSEK